MTSEWAHNLGIILSEFKTFILLQLTVDCQLPGVLQGPVLDHGVLCSAGQHPLVISMTGSEAQHRPGDVAHLVTDVSWWPDEAVRQPPGDDGVWPEESWWQVLWSLQVPDLDPAASHSTMYSLPTESGSPMLVMLTSTGGKIMSILRLLVSGAEMLLFRDSQVSVTPDTEADTVSQVTSRVT